MTTKTAENYRFYADAKFGDVIITLQSRGWILNQDHREPANLIWRNLSNTPFDRCTDGTVVNHLEGAQHFSNKGKFTRLLGLNNEGRGEPSLPRAHALEPPPKNARRSLSGEAKLTLSIEALLRDLGTQLAVGLLRHILKNSLDNKNITLYNSSLVEVCIGVASRWVRQLRSLHSQDDFFNTGSNGLMIQRPSSPSRDVLIVGGRIWELLLSHGSSVPAVVSSATAACSQSVEVRPEQLAVITQVLNDLEHLDSHFHLGGGGIWIVKPSGLSCGQGILCLDSIQHIAAACARLEFKAVIQKYIERPMLLAGRKFDIRLWVLVTAVSPLEVWAFSDCYLRLSSKPFRLDHLDDNSVHLCNYSIQTQVSPVSQDNILTDNGSGGGGGESVGSNGGDDSHSQDINIQENMVGARNFAAYVDKHYGSGSWHALLGSIRKCVVSSLTACEGQLRRKGQGFEWLGIDLMIIEEAGLRPLIIEANTSPDVSHSTVITAQLVPEATEDLFKLLLDHTTDLPQRQTCLNSSEALPHESCFPPRPCWQLWHSASSDDNCPVGIESEWVARTEEESVGYPEDRSVLPPRNLADLYKCLPALDIRNSLS